MLLNPNDETAIETNEHETISPVDINKSISLGEGSVFNEFAKLIKSSVVLPIAETTATT